MKAIGETFDDAAVSEYDESDEEQRIKDKIELFRSNVEAIIDSADPVYIRGGMGEPGSFEPDDTRMTLERMITRIENSTINEVAEFAENNFSQEMIDQLNEYLEDHDNVDLKDVVIAILKEHWTGPVEGHTEEEINELKDFIEEGVRSMDKDQLIEFMDVYLDDEDVDIYTKMLKRGINLSQIKSKMIHQLFTEYNLDDMFDRFINTDEEDEDDDEKVETVIEPETFEDAMRNDVYNNFNQRNLDILQEVIAPMSKREIINFLYQYGMNVNTEDAKNTVQPLGQEKFKIFKEDVIEGIENGTIKVADELIDMLERNRDRMVKPVRGRLERTSSSPTERVERERPQRIRFDSERRLREIEAERREDNASYEERRDFVRDLLDGRYSRNRGFRY
jgi:hypothetical protein